MISISRNLTLIMRDINLTFYDYFLVVLSYELAYCRRLCAYVGHSLQRLCQRLTQSLAFEGGRSVLLMKFSSYHFYTCDQFIPTNKCKVAAATLRFMIMHTFFGGPIVRAVVYV